MPRTASQLKLYEDAINLCGTAKVTLPSIAYTCTILAGAGLMGNLEVPYIGMIDNMTMDVEWDTATGDAVKLLTPKKHQLDLRVAEEYWDTQETEVGIWPDKYVTIVRSKSFDPGSIAPMTSSGAKSQFVVIGTDYWADVRRALGE